MVDGGDFTLSLIVLLFPALFFAQRIPMFTSFVNERKRGEFLSRMMCAVGMMALGVFDFLLEMYLIIND